jgi:Xaa-Pro aminopeptidase
MSLQEHTSISFAPFEHGHPLIPMSEFARRRKRLMRMMGEEGIAILPAAPQRLRNRDVEFPYRQDSDLYYLTGFSEPEAVAVLAPGREHGEYILFNRERDPKMEAWTGYRAGQEGACADYHADDSFPITDIDDILPGMLEKVERVYYAMGCNPEFDAQVLGWINQLRRKSRTGVTIPGEFIALDNLVHEMRLYKSRQEINLLRHAAEISVRAHQRAMAVCRPGLMEFHIEAELLHEFMLGGGRFPAYPPIVGGGANGCILHYTHNQAPLKDGDLVLIDAGAEYNHYAADITRTFPVNGRFNPEQKAVYEIVLAAQQAAIDKVVPGNLWNAPHDAAVQVLTEGLVELGLLSGHVPDIVENNHYKPFYMHRTGHWLGIDVHDVGDYKVDGEWRAFEPGMVLTVEPGLYFSADTENLPKRWWNIAVRIEDDVVVTREGSEVLTAGLPKTVEDIEAWMANAADH